MGRPYSPFTAEDARRFVPRDFSADTVLLKTEELGKKALAQSAIFRQIHERLLPLHQQQPQLVDRRALAYCGALLLSVAKAEAGKPASDEPGSGGGSFGARHSLLRSVLADF